MSRPLTQYCSFSVLAIFVSSLLSFSVFADEPKMNPISELPKSAKTKDGEIGVFVDWKNVANSQVQVFIVNRRDKPVTLQHAYGRCYLKLEVQNQKKTWDRVEVHIDEMCGTGLGEFVLKPGTWLQQSHSVSFLRNPNAKQATKNASVDTKKVIAELEASIAKMREFMTRARFTKEGLDKYNAQIKELEDQLVAAKGLQRKHDALAAQLPVKENTVQLAGKPENRMVRLRMYDFACRSASNTAPMLFDNFDAIKKCQGDAHAIRYADIGKLRAIIFDKVKFEPQQMGGLPMQNPKLMAVSALARSWHPVEEVTSTLNEIIEGKDDALVARAKAVQSEIFERK